MLGHLCLFAAGLWGIFPALGGWWSNWLFLEEASVLVVLWERAQCSASNRPAWDRWRFASIVVCWLWARPCFYSRSQSWCPGWEASHSSGTTLPLEWKETPARFGAGFPRSVAFCFRLLCWCNRFFSIWVAYATVQFALKNSTSAIL